MTKHLLNPVRTLSILVFLSATILTSHAAMAQSQCRHLFDTNQTVVALPAGISANPVQQLKLWEQISNQTRWHKPTEKVEISYVNIPNDDLVVRTEKFTPEVIKTYFHLDETVRWLRHPLNKSTTVPYLDKVASGTEDVHYSASRSMFVQIQGSLFSFKLPTDHPHPKAPAQDKADLNNDSIISMRRSKHIREFDSVTAPTPELYILTEVISVASKQGNAFSVRDLRSLQDGNYYLPAFSIPYAGREIAQLNKMNFDTFWQKNYGALLGTAKAQLLLRYGLQMKTPNAQNWLVQLDKNLKPTGRIFMRDVADSNYVDFVAEHVSKTQMKEDQDSKFTIMTSLEPYWENSSWQMDEGGVSFEVLKAWGVAHDKAYIRTIVNTLHLPNIFMNITALENYLKSPAGLSALQKYGQVTSEQPQLQKAG